MKIETVELLEKIEDTLSSLDGDQADLIGLLACLRLERNRKLLRDGDKDALEQLFKFADETWERQSKRNGYSED